MLGLPRGTVTFLFTDVEGSTRLWQDHPEAMTRAYERHDAILRDAVAAHGGAVYKVVGDAFQVAFPTAPAAVLAAIAAQRSLAGEDWTVRGLPEPLRVRMVLHTGAVDPDPDGDYRSPVLNRAGRLLAAGHGGQLLLSAAAQELVRDELPDGAGLRDLGEHRLRDLYRPERIYQVLHPALPADFLPLRTLALRPHNLPVQPTPLVGREREVASVADLLTGGGVRLVTLAGPGGIGKTRLALQIAADLVDAFPDGAWFVDLSPLTDPALVPSAIGSVLGVREEGGIPLPEALANHVRGKDLLLVLDNFEQVTEAAPLVAGLLAAASGLRVLVTSRVRLQLRGEREVPVLPLRLPDRGRVPPVDQLNQYESVRLFVERAVDVRPDFAVTNANAPAVAEICHRLDGLPLAIELAAVRVHLFPPEALLARLEKRLPLLTGGARDLPARQRTLRDAIAWSHDLLSPEEQALFRRLAVFVGGFTLEAADAADDGGSSGLDTVDGVALLADKSLLRRWDGISGELRLSMLETIREFALERLQESGETDEIRRRHAAFYLALAEEAAPALYGPAQVMWLDRLDEDHDNVRAGLGWALEHEETESALRLAGALSRFWWQRGHFTEGRGWLERALARDGNPSTRARADALHGVARVAHAQGDFAACAAYHAEALALYRSLGDKRKIAASLEGLGFIAMLRGDDARATTLIEEALALARETRDVRSIASSLGLLGDQAMGQSDRDRAAALYEEALVFARETADQVAVAFVLSRLGNVEVLRRDTVRAVALYEESLALCRHAKSPRQTILPLWGLAGIAWLAGDVERAVQLNEEALELARAVGDRQAIAPTLAYLAALVGTRGEVQRAAALAEEAVAVARGVEDPVTLAECLLAAGNAALECGDVRRSRARHIEGLSLVKDFGVEALAASGLEGLAQVAVAVGEASQAVRLFSAAAALREALDEPVAPSERRSVEQATLIVRAALGEAGFATAWTEGRALSVDDAIVLALQTDVGHG